MKKKTKNITHEDVAKFVRANISEYGYDDKIKYLTKQVSKLTSSLEYYKKVAASEESVAKDNADIQMTLTVLTNPQYGITQKMLSDIKKRFKGWEYDILLNHREYNWTSRYSLCEIFLNKIPPNVMRKVPAETIIEFVSIMAMNLSIWIQPECKPVLISHGRIDVFMGFVKDLCSQHPILRKTLHE